MGLLIPKSSALDLSSLPCIHVFWWSYETGSSAPTSRFLRKKGLEGLKDHQGWGLVYWVNNGEKLRFMESREEGEDEDICATPVGGSADVPRDFLAVRFFFNILNRTAGKSIGIWIFRTDEIGPHQWFPTAAHPHFCTRINAAIIWWVSASAN